MGYWFRPRGRGAAAGLRLAMGHADRGTVAGCFHALGNFDACSCAAPGSGMACESIRSWKGSRPGTEESTYRASVVWRTAAGAGCLHGHTGSKIFQWPPETFAWPAVRKRYFSGSPPRLTAAGYNTRWFTFLLAAVGRQQSFGLLTLREQYARRKVWDPGEWAWCQHCLISRGLAGSPLWPSSSRRVLMSSACSSSLARISSSMRRVVGSSLPR